MGQTSDQIETQIETRREDLRANFEELESKVKSATDWRQQFRANTGTMLAIAFGGGVLLAQVFGRSGGPRPYRSAERLQRAPAAPSPRRMELRQTWDSIQGALIGVAASKVKDTLADFIPGFREQIAQRDGHSPAHHSGAGYRPEAAAEVTPKH